MDLFGKAFGGIEVTLLSLGAAAVLVALKVVKEVSLIGVKFKLPTRASLRIAWGLGGLGSIAAAFWVAEPSWAPVVVVERVWAGAYERHAMQAVSDGDELYILARNGHVWRVDPYGMEEIVDNGTNTEQIDIAGGVLYVLKATGNVWSVLLQDHVAGQRSPDNAPPAGAGENAASPDRNDENPFFSLIDTGINTKFIAAAGETLYVLKNSGQIWRRSVWPTGDDYSVVVAGQNAQQIATSGAVLYYLTGEGVIRSFFPLPEAHSASAEELVNIALGKCGKAAQIVADGRRVYFRDHDGSAWLCVDGRREAIFHAFGDETVRDLDVLGGTVYLLTSKDQIVRYAPGRRIRRFPDISDGENKLKSIVAAPYGVYGIDYDGNVWRFSESLRKHR